MVSSAVVAACALVPFTLLGCGGGGSNTTPLTVKICTATGCQDSSKRVALDSTSGKTSHLVSAKDDALLLKYDQKVGGPRVYLIEGDEDKNTMFMLPGQEFTFDVELSTMRCGFNAALYFIGMTENQGNASAGTNYCDAQAVGGTYCSEMDILEANTEAQQYTTHGCVDECASFTEGKKECSKPEQGSVCDHSGCGMNPFRYGPNTTWKTEESNLMFHGFGAGFAIDTSRQFTVVTQFGNSSIDRFYMQDGKRINLPPLYVVPPTEGNTKGALENPAITADWCELTYDAWGGNPLGRMMENMKNGMVLAMSVWYDGETYVDGKLKAGDTQTGMSWMDGLNEWSEGQITKTGPCHTTTSDDGEHQATFSNIRFGPIGSTLQSTETTIV